MLEKIPCKCRVKHGKKPHYQYAGIRRNGATQVMRHSLLPVAAHLKVAGLTPNCIMWFDPLGQNLIEGFYVDSRKV
jgi:hypothetical protein